MSQYCFCFMFQFLGLQACGILAPRPGIKPTPPVLEGKLLSTELSGSSYIYFFEKQILEQFQVHRKTESSEFSCIPIPSSTINILNRVDTFVTNDESKTHHYHPKFIVDIRAHSTSFGKCKITCIRSGGASAKNLLAYAGEERPGFDPWVGKIPWRRKCQLTPVFLPEESHGHRVTVRNV